MDDPTTQDIHHLLDKFQKDVSINKNVDIKFSVHDTFLE